MDASQTEENITQKSRVLATEVTWEDYMQQYAQDFCEWVEGDVIKMSPVTEVHDLITRYLAMLLEAYFSYRPIARLRQAPFVIKLERSHEPDLQIILNDNPHELKPTYMDGPADICIEVVSEESSERDYGDKFVEYEKGGVREYWLFDPYREEARFHRLNDNNHYTTELYGHKGTHTSPLLPGLEIRVDTFWQNTLPNLVEIAESVRAMLNA